jgi:hypothetical protein
VDKIGLVFLWDVGLSEYFCKHSGAIILLDCPRCDRSCCF